MQGITEPYVMFGNPGDLSEKVTFEMVFSGMGSISQSGVRKVVLGRRN